MNSLKKLKEIMKERNMTARELSELTGIALSTLYRRLRGVSCLSVGEIIKIADVLEISDIEDVFFN